MCVRYVLAKYLCLIVSFIFHTPLTVAPFQRTLPVNRHFLRSLDVRYLEILLYYKKRLFSLFTVKYEITLYNKIKNLLKKSRTLRMLKLYHFIRKINNVYRN